MRMYKCDRCGKLVSKSGINNLSKPRIFHLGKKLHVCQECTRSFRKWFEEGMVNNNANN